MADSSDIAIKVNNVNKSFKLPHDQSNSIKSKLINFRKRGYEIQHALEDISFEVKKGEFLGIVGRNGSGKSTLLKMLAGIYTPDSGTIEINGKLTPFIELGVGFNPELSGRDNVFLNGALLGFTRKEMAEMYNDIVEFAELERFMDQKLKNYSSGMQVRLAFSIAIRGNTDILVLDEVLAVGDEAFQRKCFEYFAEIKKKKKTVILVTHSMDAVQRFCDRAILIDKGHKTQIGNPLEIAQIYRELNDQDGTTVTGTANTETKYIDAQMTYKAESGKHIFDIRLQPKVAVKDPIVAMGVYKSSGEQIYRWASDEKMPYRLDLNKHSDIRIELSDVLPVGTFTVNLFIKKSDRTIDYAIFNDIVRFETKNITPHEHDIFWKIPEKTYVNKKEV